MAEVMDAAKVVSRAELMVAKKVESMGRERVAMMVVVSAVRMGLQRVGPTVAWTGLTKVDMTVVRMVVRMAVAKVAIQVDTTAALKVDVKAGLMAGLLAALMALKMAALSVGSRVA